MAIWRWVTMSTSLEMDAAVLMGDGKWFRGTCSTYK